MNEIGSVEFETHVPLFFDPYSSNRTTGSLILIDPAANATVGAGMIQEEVAATGIAGELKTNLLLPPQTKFLLRSRNGTHAMAIFQALFYSKAERRLQKRLERLLFDLGFEAMSLRRPEFTSDNFADALRVAKLAGFIILYSGNPLTAETKHRIALEFDNRFLDIAARQNCFLMRTALLGKSAHLAGSLKFVDEPRKTQPKGELNERQPHRRGNRESCAGTSPGHRAGRQ